MNIIMLSDLRKGSKGAYNRTRQDVRLSDKLIFPFTPESLRGLDSKLKILIF